MVVSKSEGKDKVGEERRLNQQTSNEYAASLSNENTFQTQERRLDLGNGYYNWCIDSGCTSHMCNDKAKFNELKQSFNKSLNLANSSSTNISGSGELNLMLGRGNTFTKIKLENTFYVPDLRNNLLSVSKITEHGYKVIFNNDNAVVLNRSNEKIITAEKVNGLYYVREFSESSKNASNDYCSMIDVWHRRLGHLNEWDLKRLLKTEAIYGMRFNPKSRLKECHVCIKGKMTAVKFPKNPKRFSKPLEIIHSDLCGPMKTISHGGSKYFITFMDDSTGYVQVFFLKQKNEALDAFKCFKNRVENEQGLKIKCLQSDNGTEYCDSKFDEYLSEHGIKRRLTVPGTPQQNGSAERLNRTLVEMARCMLLDANLSYEFWAEAIATACYIRNRCPAKRIDGRTPYYLWYKRRPNISYFRTFGAHGFCLDRSTNRNKYADKTRPCILVGYSQQSKGYRVWLKDEEKLIITRNVKFLEGFERRDTNLVDLKDRQVEFIEYQYTNKEKDQSTSVCPSTSISGGIENIDEVRTRGRGRPKLLKTGRRGRPRKIYQESTTIRNETNENNGECEGEEIRSNENIGKDENVVSDHESIGQDSDDDEENTSAIKSIRDEAVEELKLAEVSLNDAFSGPNISKWKEAIQKEFTSLLINDTFEICNLPKNRDVVGCRLILSNKYNAEGLVERRKARLVAKGFTQKEGIDVHETFAPAVRTSSVRGIMAFAAENYLIVHQADVETAYLNGNLEEDIFMSVPEMMEETLQEITASAPKALHEKCTKMLKQLKEGNKVCKLKKALYGLRQSGRQWYKRLHQVLLDMDIRPLNSDPCVYLRRKNSDVIIIAVYVDDLIFASNNEVLIDEIKMKLNHYFKIKDLGRISYCLGIEFCQSKQDNSIKMSQKNYITELLKRFNMLECSPCATPLEAGTKLNKPENLREDINKYPYQSLVGALLFLAVTTRPDISFPVSYISQFCSNYSETHWRTAKRILRYLKGTIDYTLEYGKKGETMKGYVDADWGNNLIDRKSFSGYVFVYGGAAVSWGAKKQKTIALSSTEAEYVAMAEATKEAIYLRTFLEEINGELKKIEI